MTVCENIKIETYWNVNDDAAAILKSTDLD